MAADLSKTCIHSIKMLPKRYREYAKLGVDYSSVPGTTSKGSGAQFDLAYTVSNVPATYDEVNYPNGTVTSQITL